ncbi:MAG: alpha/beta hydrolase [Acidobacteriota bacterium]|nr:alpha/beta hydrolase [Acidobacteriota bacterium]
MSEFATGIVEANGVTFHYLEAGLEKVVVDGAGHFVHQERPEIVNARLLQFLGSQA